MMYEQYFQYDSLPAGAVLRRILKKEKVSQKELSDRTGIITQRINDLVTGKRRFTLESSSLIARCLKLSDLGYFYRLQCNHDIYLYIEQLTRQPVDLTRFRTALFWDIDTTTLDWNKHKDWIIQRVFEYGNDAEIETVIEHYGLTTIRESLDSIQDNWKKDAREIMIKRHLQ